jgi:hypothetical protein
MADEETQGKKPKQRMSEADRATLLEILKRPDCQINGEIDIPTVSRLTGLTYQTIYGFLKSDRYLKAKLREADPDKNKVVETELVDRKPQHTLPMEVMTATAAEFQEAAAIRAQNLKMLAGKWQELGMTPAQAERAEAYCKLGNAPTHGVLRYVGGQLISNLSLLDEIIKADTEKILNGNLPPEMDAKGNPKDRDVIERDWRYMVYAGMQLQLQMFSHLHKSQAILARVAADMQKLLGQKKGDEKGDFESRGGAPKSGPTK